MIRMKEFSVRAITAVVITVSLGLGGCSTTGGVEATGKTGWDDQGARSLETNIVFSSSGLKGDVNIVDLKSTLAGDIMRAQVLLRSKDNDTLQLQYRFEWYDAGGTEINSGSGSWKPLILNGRETKTVQGVAPDPRAKEFKLKLREQD